MKDQLILRLAICSEKTDESWIQGAWKIIQELAKGVVEVKEEEDEEQVENKKRGDWEGLHSNGISSYDGKYTIA